jgi:predicted Ser/Thr protein kinase
MPTNPPSPEPPRRPPRPPVSQTPTVAPDAAATRPPAASTAPTAAFVPGVSPTAALLPEQLPAAFGRYRLLKLLGKGGMGAVYLAHDNQLDRPVALKVPFFREGDAALRERFFREARAAATLSHANICPVHDVGEFKGVHFLTMGFVEGKPLSDLMRTRVLTPRQYVSLLKKIALALDEAHRRKVIHRDLKPANIMISRQGEPIVMDFGLARRGDSNEPKLTQDGSIMGTPAYMAPEQARGKSEEMGPSCDIYSLGVILYEMLAGRLPFLGDMMAILSQVLCDEPKPPSAWKADVDPRLEAICRKAMARTPSQRYGSMADFAAALNDYLKAPNPVAVADTVAYVPKPPPAPPPLPRGMGGPPVLPHAGEPPAPRQGGGAVKWIAAAAAALVVGAIVLLILFGGGKNPDSAPKTPEGGTKTAEAWSLDSIRKTRVLAPDLTKRRPDVYWDYRQAEGEGGNDARWNTGRSFHIANGYWDLWQPEKQKPDGAYQVVGRATDRSAWGLILHDNEGKSGVAVYLDDLGRFHLDVSPWGAEETTNNPTNATIAWTEHSAIHKGTEWNTLLVVLDRSRLEIYVNQRAVCMPIQLNHPVASPVIEGATLHLRDRPGQKDSIEIERFYIWYGHYASPTAALSDAQPARPTPRPPAWSADEIRDSKIAAPTFDGVTPLMDDPLKSKDSGFYHGKLAEEVQCRYQGGNYRIHRPTAGDAWLLAPPPEAAPAKEPRDAACRVIGKTLSGKSSWGVELATAPGSLTPCRATLSIDEAGRLHVETTTQNQAKGVRLPPIEHSAIKSGPNAVNTLLAVIRGGRVLELYVNGVAVAQPIVLDAELTCAWQALIGRFADAAGGEVAFQQFTIWRMDNLPAAERTSK